MSRRALIRVLTPLAVVAVSAGLVVGVAAPASAATVTTTLGSYSYSADDADVSAGATITAYTGPGGAVVVPSSVVINSVTYDITVVGNGAFESKGITALTLPNSLVEVDANGFSHNSYTSLTLPDSMRKVEASGFSNGSLATLNLGNGIVDVQANSFAGNAITTLTIPDSLTTIEGSAFTANALTSLDLGSGVQTLGTGAFENNSLTSVVIPASVTELDNDAFDDSTLTSVTFDGAPPTTLGADVFGVSTTDPEISFFWRFEAPGFAGGFTAPTWDTYPSQAIAVVTFNGNGGSSTPTQDVVVGSLATQPTDPTRAGYAFAGWSFTDAVTGGSSFDFSSAPITSDTAMTANWNRLAETGVPISPWMPVGGVLALLAGIALLLVRRRSGASRLS